jgi:taspase (threonine aspartase 1)
MDGRSNDFGSVGAVPGNAISVPSIISCLPDFSTSIVGVQNPIRIARSILDYSRKLDPIGRIPPLYVHLPFALVSWLIRLSLFFCSRTLTSDGARSFALTHVERTQTIPSESLVSPRALEEWKKWKDRLQDAAQDGPTSSYMQDTVGAVAHHHMDGMAAGVSRSFLSVGVVPRQLILPWQRWNSPQVPRKDR